MQALQAQSTEVAHIFRWAYIQLSDGATFNLCLHRACMCGSVPLHLFLEDGAIHTFKDMKINLPSNSPSSSSHSRTRSANVGPYAMRMHYFTYTDDAAAATAGGGGGGHSLKIWGESRAIR